MQHLRTFAMSIGKRYQDLVPNADLVSPNKTHDIRAYEGWAYCARTADKNIFLAYFEKGCPRSQIRGAKLNSLYRAEWFDPRKGDWQDAGSGTVRSSVIGIIMLPDFPAAIDWGLRLTYTRSCAAFAGPRRAWRLIGRIIWRRFRWPSDVITRASR